MLRARDLMQEDVAVIRADASLAELEREFSDAGVSGFPVLSGGTAVGVVTRADVVRALARRPHPSGSAETLRVEDVMTGSIVAVERDTPLKDVARTLVAHRVHRVLVMEDGAVAGILSALDIVDLLARGKLREA